MQISAIGKGKGIAARRPTERGFTLVELLIVLTIIGLMSAAVVLSIPGEGRSLRADAESFAAKAQAAQERAILDGRPIAMRVTRDGYRFEQRRSGEWRELAEKPFAASGWRQGVTASVAAEASAGTVFDSTGMAEPLELTLQHGDDKSSIGIGADGRVHVRS